MRDVNGLSYWQFANEADFDLSTAPTLEWDATRHALGLQGTAQVPPTRATLATIQGLSADAPLAVDAYGTYAWVTPGINERLQAAGAGEAVSTLYETRIDARIKDFEWTPDGQVIIAEGIDTSGVVMWTDRLERFNPVTLQEAGFIPDRIAVPASSGPIWVVERRSGDLRWLAGTPVPRQLEALSHPVTEFAAKPEMADPPRLEIPPTSRATGTSLLDACADATGALVLLHRTKGSAQPESLLEIVWPDGTQITRRLTGVTRAFSVVPFAPGHVALVSPDWVEARVYRLPDAEDATIGDLLPLSLRLPLRNWTGGRLCRGATGKAHYPRNDVEARFAVLAPVSMKAHTTKGRPGDIVIDSGVEGFVWHRFYLEAQLPKGCKIKVAARAHDMEDGLRTVSRNNHFFGDVIDTSGAPRGVWMDAASEHPHGRAAMACPRKRDRAGLFSCLIQSSEPDQEISRIAGRFLQLRITLTGNRASTPRLYALRAWGPRFSYRDAYLPALFSIESGPGAKGSDFLDRYLSIFESVLTPLEGEIAQTWRGASAKGTPVEALDWLANWVGVIPDSALGEAGKRRLIGAAARLAPWHATLKGLEGLLDIATNGGVQRGDVVVVENFRMRRTFATILGADFSDRDDPMTRGTRSNGNSHLGPGFFIGSDDQKQLFALFRPELLDHDLTSPAERALAVDQLDALFEEEAHRVTILVHRGLEPDMRGLVARIVEREVPAHVIPSIYDAPESLLLGLSSLLGVETRLGTPAEIGGITVGETKIGQGRLRGTPALDPTLG